MNNNQKTSEEISELLKKHLQDISTQQNVFSDEKLLRRKIMPLFLAAAGKALRESAEFLKIMHNTVQAHRKCILRKLNCQNIGHAVYKGVWLVWVYEN
jgi:DNA-binding NarL/FixJ family response regulator